MPVVSKGPAPGAIYKYVPEAVGALGYFRPDCVMELIELFRSAWVNGVSATMLLNTNFQTLLSEKGAKAPSHAAQATAKRVIFNVRRQIDLDNEPQWRTFIDQVRFSCLSDHCC